MSSTVKYPRFAGRVGGYGNRGEKAVCLWVEISEDGRDVKAVNKE